MIYLDNAATSFPKAPGVGAAAAAFIASDAANPGRAGHRMAVAAEAMLDGVRLKLARMIGAAEPERVVFTMNGTDALNIAIKGVVASAAGSGGVPHVVTTVLEHNSVSRPLQALADAGAIMLTRLDCDDAGLIPPEGFKKALTPQTVLFVLTHASNVTGTIQDAAAVGAVAREAGVLFLLDAAQTLGVVPIDVGAMHVDLLAAPGHKSLLGPTGTGLLWVGDRCPPPEEDPRKSARFMPYREGGTGGDSATPTQPALYPYYLEGGTPNTVGIAGLSAGIDHVLGRPMEDVLGHEQALCGRLIEFVESDERFTLLGGDDPSARVGTVSLTVEGLDAPDVGSILDDSFDVAVRPGLHCSPYAHRRFGTFPDGAVRVSPGPFSTGEDMDTLIGALGEIAG
ncbi:MAG: aminotransferase class V-fold PLP-dependent enzyme [Planctomycetota bacterium]